MPDAPTTHAGVLASYDSKIEANQRATAALRTRRTWLFRVMAAVLLVIAVLMHTHEHSNLVAVGLAASFAGIVALIWAMLRVGNTMSYHQRLVDFYEACRLRADGTRSQSGKLGQDLTLRDHLYEHDLNLLGPDSLFGLLATVRTGPGERGLARYLQLPATHAETVARQEAVRELLPQTELRESIALLGNSKFHQITAGFFDDWLEEPVPTFPVWTPWLLALTALTNVVILLLGILRVWTWGELLPNLAAVLLMQGIVSLWLRRRVAPILARGVRLEQPVKLLAQGLELLQQQRFECPKLQTLQRAAQVPAGAVKAIRRLRSQLEIVEQRPKEWYFLLFSLLLAAGTQAAIAIAAWKRRHAADMAVWLNVWAEFEALNALATYAYEHPEDAWPELLPPDHAPLFAATALGHPLLEGAVTNDLSLGAADRFYLISGSNMAGKSTLLRSIGINAVLAYAGAPVRAHSLRLTPLTLGASLALTDSLAEGKSKFLAEVTRLAAVVAASKAAPVLFLVDEIFSGTNSSDRSMAAGAVVNSLLANGAIGALSTHDLALTSLAAEANGGLNVHMSSPDDADPLAFDYKLKPGVNTSSNALAIVRMMGLDA